MNLLLFRYFYSRHYYATACVNRQLPGGLVEVPYGLLKCEVGSVYLNRDGAGRLERFPSPTEAEGRDFFDMAILIPTLNPKLLNGMEYAG